MGCGMTNKKFKNYHKNKIAYDVIVDNYKMLCIILLTLHDIYPKTFYAKKMQEWLEDFAESCKMMNEYEADDMYDYKMKQFADECRINENDCIMIVRKHLSKYNYQNTKVLAENVKLALVQLCFDFGFGEVRLKRLTNALLTTDRPDALKEIKAFGINYEWDLGQVDCTKLAPKKKNKVTIAEANEARANLQWLKAYQDSVINGNETE